MVILTFMCCYFVIKTNENKLIEAWSTSVAVFVALAYFSLEILSAFSMITRTALLIFCAIVFVVLLILSFHLIKKEKGFQGSGLQSRPDGRRHSADRLSGCHS